MAGIYLHYCPNGLDENQLRVARENIENRIVVIPGHPVETHEDHFCIGASSHHGVFPSGGIHECEKGVVLSSGSVWINPGDPGLASPKGIFEALNRAPDTHRNNLGGVFAIAIIDNESRSLSVLCDRFGSMPVYYRVRGDLLVVGSEIKFICDPGHEELDEIAYSELVCLGYISRGHTLVKGVRRLQAHQQLVFGRMGARISNLDRPGYSRNVPVTDEAIEEFDRLVKFSLSRYVPHADRFSIAISGGLDSRLLAGAARRIDLPLEGFAVGEKRSADVVMAERVARSMGIPFSLVEIQGWDFQDWFPRVVWTTEGRVLPNHIHYMRGNLFDQIPDMPQLHGLVGEAIFGGAFDRPGLVHADPTAIRNGCWEFTRGLIYWPDNLVENTFTKRIAELAIATKQEVFDELLDRIQFSGNYEDYLDYKWRFRVDGFTVPCLIGQVLPWRDVISPFLDKDVFDLGATLSADGLVDRSAQIRWASNLMPEITKLPRIKDGISVPIQLGIPDAYDSGLKRRMFWANMKFKLCRVSRGRINPSFKGSFPIYGQWYRRHRKTRNFVNEYLLSDQALSRGLYHRAGISELLKDYRTGKNYWNNVGTLLLAEIFIRQFIEGTESGHR